MRRVNGSIPNTTPIRPLRWAYFSRREGRGWREPEHQKNGPLESSHLLKTQQSQGTCNLAQKEPDVLLSTRDDVMTAVPESGLRREYDKEAFEMGFSRDSYLSAGGKSASDDRTLRDSPHPTPTPPTPTRGPSTWSLGHAQPGNCSILRHLGLSGTVFAVTHSDWSWGERSNVHMWPHTEPHWLLTPQSPFYMTPFFSGDGYRGV